MYVHLRVLSLGLIFSAQISYPVDRMECEKQKYKDFYIKKTYGDTECLNVFVVEAHSSKIANI